MSFIKIRLKHQHKKEENIKGHGENTAMARQALGGIHCINKYGDLLFAVAHDK